VPFSGLKKINVCSEIIWLMLPWALLTLRKKSVWVCKFWASLNFNRG
jgi:hypothetical protein